MVELLMDKLRFLEVGHRKSVFIGHYHKLIYSLQNTELSLSYFLRFLLNSLFYIILFLPILFYSKEIYGDKIHSLISSLQERDFLFVWLCISSVAFTKLKTSSLVNYKQDIRMLITSFIYLSTLFIIMGTERKLSVGPYEVDTSVVTILVILSLIVMTRYMFSKNLIEIEEESNTLKILKQMNQRVYLFSLTTITSATILKVLGLHIDVRLEPVMPLMISSVLYFVLSFEKKIWKSIDSFQREYLELKYQFPIQFIILGFLCCMYYFL